MPADFPHPYLAVDLVVLTWQESPGTPLGGELRLGLVERTDPAAPPTGWALAGAYVQVTETVPDAARRVLRDKLGLAAAGPVISLTPFSDVDRDDRRRTVSVPAVVLLPRTDPTITGRGARWGVLRCRPGGRAAVAVDGRTVHLAFDHDAILAAAVAELQRRLALDDLEVLAHLLGEPFALRELERAWNTVAGSAANTPAFRRRVVGLSRALPGDVAGGRRPWIEPTGASERDVGRRPARLYRWTPAAGS